MDISCETNTDYSQHLNKFEISILALPLFVKDKVLHPKEPAQRHILNMDNINMRLCRSDGVESIKNTITNKNLKEVLDAKYTLVPYKSYKSTKQKLKKPHCSLIVSHMSIKRPTNELRMDGINMIVKNEFAEPLTEEEMEEFIKHLKSCKIEFDKHKHKDYIIELASALLSQATVDKLREDIKELDFYQAYQNLREVYQEMYPYRIGICDGAHRITAMFNIIHGIEIKRSGLSISQDNPKIEDLNNLEAKAPCEVWEYKPISESIKIKRIFKIIKIVTFIKTFLQLCLIVPQHFGYMMYQQTVNINQIHV